MRKWLCKIFGSRRGKVDRNRDHRTCSRIGHQWVTDSARRKCSRCQMPSTLFYNRFPKIGEPLMEWRDTPEPVFNLEVEQ